VTTIKAGDAYNVIPQVAEMRGTVRYFKTEVRDVVIARLREIAGHLAQAMRCTAEVHCEDLTIPVVNHPDVGAKLRALFAPLVGEQNLDATVRTMGAEDVSLFMDDIPGMYFFVGAQDQTADTYYGHHHPCFTIDEAALPLGAGLLASAAATYVLPES
jgi:amidohydrolase